MRAVFSIILMAAIVACHSLAATHVHFDLQHGKSHGQQPHFHLFGVHSHDHHHDHDHGDGHGDGHEHARHHRHERERTPESPDGQWPDSNDATYGFVDSTVTKSHRLDSADVSTPFSLLVFESCVEGPAGDLTSAADERCVSPASGSTARTPRYLRDCSIRI